MEYGYQGLHAVTLSQIDQVNENIRLFRLELSEGSVQASTNLVIYGRQFHGDRLSLYKRLLPFADLSS